MSVMVTIVLLKVESTCATPEWTFLLPFALMIFGFSTSFGSSDKFSFTGSGAASSFFALGAFFAGLGGAAGASGVAATAPSAGVVDAAVASTGAPAADTGVSVTAGSEVAG